jgi:hypothetical protein
MGANMKDFRAVLCLRSRSFGETDKKAGYDQADL